MEIFTKGRSLVKKENDIKKLILSGEKRFLDTFNLIYNYYLLDNVRGKSNCFAVLKAIYIDNLSMPSWKLAEYCHLSKTSLFDYRNDIVSLFYSCLQQNIVMREIAITKG